MLEPPDKYFLEANGLILIEPDDFHDIAHSKAKSESQAALIEAFMFGASLYYHCDPGDIEEVRFIPASTLGHWVPLAVARPGAELRPLPQVIFDEGFVDSTHPFVKHVFALSLTYNNTFRSPGTKRGFDSFVLNAMFAATLTRLRNVAGLSYGNGYRVRRDLVAPQYFYLFSPMESPVMETL